MILAGKEYGSGSSRDWAAKGTALLGVRAVVAESYERIHRSNLIGMGVLPLQYAEGQDAESLGLTGQETFSIEGVAGGDTVPRELTVKAVSSEGAAKEFTVVCTDLRGYGDSSKPPGGDDHSGYSFRNMGLDNIEVMAALGPALLFYLCMRGSDRPNRAPLKIVGPAGELELVVDLSLRFLQAERYPAVQYSPELIPLEAGASSSKTPGCAPQ